MKTVYVITVFDRSKNRYHVFPTSLNTQKEAKEKVNQLEAKQKGSNLRYSVHPVKVELRY